MVLVGAALLALLAGCGSTKKYANSPRPPDIVNVTAAITDNSISLSPKSFGAGPILLIVSNQTDKTRELTLETDEIGGDEAGIKTSTGPINPDGTASLKADLRKGTYKLEAKDDKLKPLEIRVTDERRSSQNELLQP